MRICTREPIRHRRLGQNRCEVPGCNALVVEVEDASDQSEVKRQLAAAHAARAARQVGSAETAAAGASAAAQRAEAAAAGDHRAASSPPDPLPATEARQHAVAARQAAELAAHHVAGAGRAQATAAAAAVAAGRADVGAALDAALASAEDAAENAAHEARAAKVAEQSAAAAADRAEVAAAPLDSAASVQPAGDTAIAPLDSAASVQPAGDTAIAPLDSTASVQPAGDTAIAPLGSAASVQLADDTAIAPLDSAASVQPPGHVGPRLDFGRLAQTIIAPIIGSASSVGKFLAWRWAALLLVAGCIAVTVWWGIRPHPINLADERAKAEALIFGNAPVQAVISEGVKARSLGYRDVAALLFKHAADNNNAEGARHLGMVYDPTQPSANSDREPKADLWSAFIWYTKAAVLGDGVANEQLEHLKGWAAGTARDGDQDARLIRQDFALASAKAMIESNIPAGAALDQAREAQEKSRFDLAILLFRHAADHNNAEGARRLGMVYDPTLPTVDADHQPKANARFAYTWYKRAIDLRDPLAAKYLIKLMAWAKDAATRGDLDAQQLIDRPGQP